MISTLFKRIFGSRNDRLVKQYAQKAQEINALEPAMQALINTIGIILLTRRIFPKIAVLKNRLIRK